jgi:hypothetical protein
MKFYLVRNTCQYKVCGDRYVIHIYLIALAIDLCFDLKKRPPDRVESLNVDGIGRFGYTRIFI